MPLCPDPHRSAKSGSLFADCSQNSVQDLSLVHRMTTRVMSNNSKQREVKVPACKSLGDFLPHSVWVSLNAPAGTYSGNTIHERQ